MKNKNHVKQSQNQHFIFFVEIKDSSRISIQFLEFFFKKIFKKLNSEVHYRIQNLYLQLLRLKVH